MKIYVVDKFDTGMLGYTPNRLIMDNIPKANAILDLTVLTDNYSIINTIEDGQTLNYIEKELGVKLQPSQVLHIKLEKGDALIIVLKRGEDYYFYEVVLWN
jgi:hypothetical protein